MLLCPLCNKPFVCNRKPRILPCYHTFCTPCLEALWRCETGVIPCPKCANEERFDSTQNIAIDLALLEEGEEEDPLLEGHDPFHYLRELGPPTVLPNTEDLVAVAVPVVPVPHKITCRSIYVKLAEPMSFPNTTKVVYRTDRRRWMPFFNVTYYKSKSTRLFRSSGDFFCDRMEFWARDPKFKDIGGHAVKISPSGIICDVVQVLAIVEDAVKYEVFLDGLMLVTVWKVIPDEERSLCKKIRIEGISILIQSCTVFKGRIPF